MCCKNEFLFVGDFFFKFTENKTSQSYSQKKDFKAALTKINECLSVKPNYPDAYNLKRQIVSALKWIPHHIVSLLEMEDQQAVSKQ